MFDVINSRKNTDYIAMWFDVRKELGISDAMSIGRLNKLNGVIDWKQYPHSKMDGLGGVATMLREYGYPCYPLPVGRDNSEPSFLNALLASLKEKKDSHSKSISWKKNYICGYDNEAVINTHFFTENETKQIKANGKKRKVALSTYILWALNKSIADNLLSSKQSYFWFYPVNLRGAVEGKGDTSNFSSGVNVCVSNDIHARDLQSRIREKLRSSEYWMTWKLAHIGRFIGMQGVRSLYKKMSEKNFYAGSFSYLGSWPLKDESNPKKDENEAWVTCGIGTKNYPVSTGVMEWYGQLSLGLKLHPWIANDERIGKKCLSDWKNNLLQEVKA